MHSRSDEAETASIASATHDGRGIAALPGKKVFVAGALPGEVVRFKRRRRRRKRDDAELLEVIETSAARVEPRCAVYGTCGGCWLQHASADEQRRLKMAALQDSLARIGKVEPATWLAPLFDSSGGFNYRRRARLAVKDVGGKGRVLVGFRERYVPFITDMHRCEILAHPVDALIDPLSELVGDLSIRKRLPQIEVAVAENAVSLLFRVLDPPSDRDKERFEAFAREHELRVLLQSGGADSIEPLYPAGDAAPLCYQLPDFEVTINFGVLDFIQINAAVNRLMVGEAVRLLDLQSHDRVLDLFCGIGNFSLPLARSAHEVLGIDLEASQIKRAKDNATWNGIENCRFQSSDLANIDDSATWLREKWDKLLLDPARSGAAAVVEVIERIAAGRIVYVSCNPGSLARDAASLVREHGYAFEAAGIVDMFPHTGHVEAIAVFQKT
ncbi:MAG: 23S rRNA (uracil(1939)-C(5))-methyltransferase RlmD [Woeseiaceae bacterium]|nr:23S rRNA (uracil(1939)-C(5))-methyltransferase RlmD [Woeseiaceae bacterium]